MKNPWRSAHHFVFAAALLVIITAAGTAADAQDLTEFESEYAAYANGIKATATRKLQMLSDGSYQFNSNLTAKIVGTTIAALSETSRFQLIREDIAPLQYQYTLSGISDETKLITFNREAMIAVSSEALKSWPVEFDKNTQDPLSYQLELARQIAVKTDVIYEIPVIDGDSTEIQRFQIIGEEVIESMVGELRCIIIEKIREANDPKSTTIWLAKDHAYLLTKLEQTTKSGLTISLELNSATVADRMLKEEIASPSR